MRVSAVNFKGIYEEKVTDKFVHGDVKRELDEARPFLKHLARVLPYDLHVNVYDCGDGDTHLDVDCFDSRQKKSYNLVKTNEYLLRGNGFYLLSDVFCGLEKMDSDLFERTAKRFVKGFDRINMKLFS